MKPQNRLAWVLFAVSALVPLAAHAQVQHPADRWEFALEGGYLHKVKHNSPWSYRIVPMQVAWLSPAFQELWRSPEGMRLTVRHRFAIIAEGIVRGPEDHYFAVSGSPLVEMWSADRRTAAYFELGGGVGFINSKGVPGGQGQDLAFNWFSQGGIRRQLDRNTAITAAIYFTHHSNLGMTNPNPGIDVLGLNFGVVQAFR